MVSILALGSGFSGVCAFTAEVASAASTATLILDLSIKGVIPKVGVCCKFIV
jgi:hypothetical protein